MGEGETNSENGSPFVNYPITFLKGSLFVLHIFGTYWLCIYLNNLNDFVTAAITVNFYFGTNIKNLNIFCHSLGNHSGSIAWTIILLPMLILQLLFLPFTWCFTTNRPNSVQKKVNHTCHSCCSCYELYIDSINENFMAITYTGSKNFFDATRIYFYLTEKYIDAHATASFLSSLYSGLGKLCLGSLAGYCGVLIYRSNLEMQQNIKYVGTIFSICLFLGTIISSLLINIFSTAYDTIVICFLVETDLYNQNETYEFKCNDEINEVLKSTIDPKSKSYMRLK